jgi:hypothetical protein
MARVCPDCGAGEDTKRFYSTSVYCADCHNTRMVEDSKQPHRRPKVNEYNNQWLKSHRAANRDAQQRWRARQRAERAPWTIPPDRATVPEVMARLQIRSRFRVAQLIDQGRLRAVKEHGQWLIVRADVERLAAERGESAAGRVLSAGEDEPRTED